MTVEPPNQPGLSSIDVSCMREKETLLFKPLLAEVNPDRSRTLTLKPSFFQCAAISEES